MKRSLLVLSSICLAASLLGVSACQVTSSSNTPDPDDGPKVEGNENGGNNGNIGNIGGQEVEGAEMLASFRGKITPLSYAERRSEEFVSLKRSAEDFAATFTEAASVRYDAGDNFAVSPLSVYMALSLAAECAKDETKAEILTALQTDESGLRSDYSALYRSLEAEYRTSEYDGNKLIGCVDLSNSVWVDQTVTAKKDCLDILANNFYCSSYSANFVLDNQTANAAVREFIKEQTRGLIDQDFALSNRTVFALINTLYLKDVWNTFGQDLSFTADRTPFRNADGTVTNERLLSGYYRYGQTVETERYSHFLTSTENGYKLKFIVPKEGYTAKELCTKEVLAEVNAITDYHEIDEANNIRYNTRCLFPEFTAEYDEDVIPILKEAFGIKKLFDPFACDLTAMTDEDAYCSRVQHVTKLNVDKTGVEGAAVTVMMNEATSAPAMYTDVHEDFLVDRAFVFLLTDRYDTPLFTGIVNRV